MGAEAVMWIWIVGMLLAVVVGLVLTLIGMPGNWLMVAAACIYAWQMPEPSRAGFGWPVVVTLLLLAVLGEVLEFLAGALGAAKAGGSRRSAALAIVGSIAGGVVGLLVGVPIPVIGSLVAAVLFAAVGAMLGAILGETWKGRSAEATLQVGWGAFRGRLVGTLAKLSIGGAMAVVTLAAMLI